MLISEIFRALPWELRRVTSQQIGSVDSIHRNIAEGYTRRSLKEYLQFLNYALGSVGESVSGLHAYLKAGQITEQQFAEADTLAYKLENGLLRLVGSLQRKYGDDDWEDSFVIRESNNMYASERDSEN